MDKLDSLKSAHQAARDGLLCRLEEFIKEYADLINFRSVDEDTLLDSDRSYMLKRKSYSQFFHHAPYPKFRNMGVRWDLLLLEIFSLTVHIYISFHHKNLSGQNPK